MYLSAEKEGFEPPDLLQSTVFKTAALDRSAISPGAKVLFFSHQQSSFKKYFFNFIELLSPNPIHLYKALLLTLLSFLCPLIGPAQIIAYFNHASFNTPQNNPYLETYLTISGKSLFAKPQDQFYQNSANILITITHNGDTIKTQRYNLLSPTFTNSTQAPVFLDVQRFALPSGNYELTMELRDNFDPANKSLTIKDQIQYQFKSDSLQFSDLEVLESYQKSTSTNALSKSGFNMVPYTVNYYPESTNELCFYLEAYNSDKILGANKNFVYAYSIELATDNHKISNYGAFKKQSTAAINPLLAKIDISKLGTGDYYLVVDLIDETNTRRLQKKFFFQRLNRKMDVMYLQQVAEKESVASYFGNCNNADTLKMFVECLWPIADGVDKERIINQSVKKNPEMMKKFVIDFWERRAADTANPLRMWARYYQSVQQVMVLFKCGKQPGYYSDRGRVYLQYGAPNQRSQQNNEQNTFPYEIWQYYRTTDATNGQFFSNRKFVFVNKKIGDDCFDLVHSDMRGEINNPRWQFEITRRNNNGLGNPDNTTPAGTESNQFNEIFSNPR